MGSKYFDPLKQLFQANPKLTQPTATSLLGISKAQFYNLKPSILKSINTPIEEYVKTQKRRGKEVVKKVDTKDLKEFKSVIPAIEDFIEFVGFQGYYANECPYVVDEATWTLTIIPLSETAHTSTTKTKRCSHPILSYPSITKTPTILIDNHPIPNTEPDPENHKKKHAISDIRKEEYKHALVSSKKTPEKKLDIFHEGETHPPPIDEDGNELGLLLHELEGFVLIWGYLKSGIMFKWPRGFGKTYLATWYIQWSMYRLAAPWMYLSSTEVLGDVAYWIYLWAKAKDLIGVDIKGGKQKTYRQFELKNGAKMRIFDYMGEGMVGQHGWYLAMDDVVKKKWEDKPSDLLKAKRQWLYSLKWMRRKGIMIFGTRKFPGDLLEFFEKVIKSLTIEVKTPYIMEGEFPDWIPKEKDGKEILWVPELYTWEDLEDKKTAPTDDGSDPLAAWQAEMMQDPRPIAGKRWPSLDGNFVDMLGDMHAYDIMYFYIDRATTAKDGSDYTGFVQGLREYDTGVRIIINDYTSHITMEQLLFYLSFLIDFFHRQYPYIGIVVYVEKQGGGDDFETSARNRTEFEGILPEKPNTIIKIPNYIRQYSGIEARTSTGDKKKRIKDRLGAPIDNKVLKFLRSLKHSFVVDSVLDFPYNKRFDALDALSFDFYLMSEYPVMTRAYAGDIITVYDNYSKGALPNMMESDHMEGKVESMLEHIKGIYKGQKQKVVFE
jgi:hypothetical protein